MDKSNKTIELAKKYAALGFRVFPCKEHGKEPCFKNWQTNATNDIEAISTIWTRNPQFNIGIATGSVSKLLVIDVDNHGADGSASLHEWELNHKKLPDTATVITGSGGTHYYYHTDKIIKGCVGVLPGVDIRADGNLVIAPPSIHPNGNAYEWDAGADLDDIGITEANDVVLELCGWESTDSNSSNAANGREKYQLPNKLSEGSREIELFRYAASLRSKAVPHEKLTMMVEAANTTHCDIPLDNTEIEKCIFNPIFDKYPAGCNYNDILSGKPIVRIGDKGKEIDLIGCRTTKGITVRQCTENAVRVLEHDALFKDKIRYNEFGFTYEYANHPIWHKDPSDMSGVWSDTDDSYARSRLDLTYGLKNKDNYIDAFRIVADKHSYNPVKEWLNSLPEWDGVSRIENLLPDYLGAEKSDYTIEVMKLFMVGAVSRIYEPGCKFDYVFVLVGEQGAGKTTFLQRLAVFDEWYDGNLNTIEAKEGAERLRGKWILEMAELLAVKRQKDVEGFKAFITVTTDSYRPPYGVRTEQRPRMCVFAATTNDMDFMTDPTGNRRYLPVFVSKSKQTKSLFDKNQDKVCNDFLMAWSEALYIYKHDHPQLILPSELEIKVETERSRYTQEDAYQGKIEDYLLRHPYRVCANMLWDEALGMKDKCLPKPNDQKRINQIMRNMSNWHCIGRQRVSGYGNVTAYEPDLVDVSDDELIPF